MTDAVAADAVGAGDHACLTFTDAEERWDLIAALVRDGLKTGSKVVCWTDTITPDALAEQLTARSVRPGAALRRGQLRLAPVTGVLLGDGSGAAAMVGAVQLAGVAVDLNAAVPPPAAARRHRPHRQFHGRPPVRPPA
jgi:hypothetical protein